MANILSIEERQDRDEEFVRCFVELGGNATAAARAVGVSEASASTTGNRMKERLWKPIEDEIVSNMKGYAPKAVEIIKRLSESATSENVQLHAAKDLLDRGGLKPTEKQQVEYKSPTDDMTTEEIKTELNSLHQQWLKDYLKENNFKLVDAARLEEISEELQRRIEVIQNNGVH
jgi:hypothetical protein